MSDAATFRFELVCPERLVMAEEALQVVVPGTEGEFTMLPGHAPLLTTLKPGVLEITLPNAPDVRRIYVRGGFAEADPESLTVLAQQAIDLAALDAERLAQEVRNLEEDVADAQDDETRNKAEFQLNRLKELQAALNR